jgi:predicted AAA+ superfamily ATPase
MEKELIKRLIAEKQHEITKVELIQRSLSLEKACNYVFIGLRRAGKSYLMYQLIQDAISWGDLRIEDVCM